jgi:hypothetical protein
LKMSDNTNIPVNKLANFASWMEQNNRLNQHLRGFMSSLALSGDSNNDNFISQIEFTDFFRSSENVYLSGSGNAWLEALFFNRPAWDSSIGKIGAVSADTKTQNRNLTADVLVYGNGLTSVVAAVEAKRANPNLNIILVRAEQPNEPFGEIAESGLAYLDHDSRGSKFKAPIWAEILKRAGVQDVSADPSKLDNALREMLVEAGVEVHHEVTQIKPEVNGGRISSVTFGDKIGNSLSIKSRQVIDGSENADLARAAGIKFDRGFQSAKSSLAGSPSLENSSLGITPVILLKNMSLNDIVEVQKEIFKKIRSEPKYKESLTELIRKYFTDQQKKKLIEQLDNPPKPHLLSDGLDLTSMLIPLAYHQWSGKPMQHETGKLEMGNIALIELDGKPTVSYNGLVYSATTAQVEKLVTDGGLDGAKPTQTMIEDLRSIEAFFKQFKPDIKLVPPKELYIRHNGNVNASQVVKPLTQQELLEGGVKAPEAIGSFSYFMDARGGIKDSGGFDPVIATYNLGIEHTLVNNKQVNNLAVVSRSSAYTGYVPTVGRIIEGNVSVASAVGRASAIANEQNKALSQITSSQVRQATKTAPILGGQNITKSVDPKLVDNKSTKPS